jgi:hypothetical protein
MINADGIIKIIKPFCRLYRNNIAQANNQICIRKITINCTYSGTYLYTFTCSENNYFL